MTTDGVKDRLFLQHVIERDFFLNWSLSVRFGQEWPIQSVQRTCFMFVCKKQNSANAGALEAGLIDYWRNRQSLASRANQCDDPLSGIKI